MAARSMADIRRQQERAQIAAAGPSLTDRFVVPPFSVLDARQGYWQERKRQWLALGIQSELGRGEQVTWAAGSDDRSVTEPGLNYYRNQNRGLLGFSDEATEPGMNHYRSERRNLLGFSNQTEDYRTGRGSYNKGRKADARTFGQDMMRGEYTVGDAARDRDRDRPPEAASLAGGLTFNTTLHPYDKYGQDKNQRADGDAGAASESTASGTSIFDPVLCELVYRWFSPPGGSVLDPFAGGSVRGIVAARLGRGYTGIDLRPEQLEANEEQVARILGQSSWVPVKLSAAHLRQAFNGCEPDYIRDVCHASCCDSSTAPNGTMITIHPTEEAFIAARGGEVVNGLLQPRPGERRCPFKTAEHLCGLHGTGAKPFGCIASPFTLNRSDTLIVRNRYRLLKCYNDGRKLPAYVAFRASLDRLFGLEEAERICAHLDAGGDDLTASMPADVYHMLHDNDEIKHGAPVWQSGIGNVRYVVGDARDVRRLAPGEYDLIFSCPPYGDLERYSDDPRDLSTLEYPQFIQDYRAIISEAVGLLHPDRFAVFVVGDIRDKRGLYRNFVAHTIGAFQKAGAHLYNDAVLLTAAGSLPIRVGKQFVSSRKLGKTHQSVLIFVKGDPRKATAACGEVVVDDIIKSAGFDGVWGEE